MPRFVFRGTLRYQFSAIPPISDVNSITMKKLFTFVVLLFATAGFSQTNDIAVFKSDGYIIDGVPSLEPDTILTLSDTDMYVKSVGNLRILKKAIAVKNTSVYLCEFEGKPVEVITVITPEKLKVTVRGESLKRVIESDLMDAKKIEAEFSKRAVSVKD